MEKTILRKQHIHVVLTSELALWITSDRDDAVFL